MNKLNLAKAIQDDGRRSLPDAELQGPSAGDCHAQDREVVGSKERLGLFARACYVHGKKICIWMLFLEFL